MNDRWIVPGSERTAPPGAYAGEIDEDETATVTIIVRSKHSTHPPPGHFSREEFASVYGAGESDLQRIEAFAARHGLTVVTRDAARCTVQVRGRLGDLCNAFGVKLATYREDTSTYRGRTGPISLPPDLADLVVAVLGLDTRPQARAHHRVAVAPAASFTPRQIAQFYDFPPGVTGSGETVGILELGGGYAASDFAAYCSQLGIAAPSVTVVPVDGASSAPGVDKDADTEVMLDIEIAGTVAPGARFVMYFAPNTDQGFIDGITAAVHDAANKPTVLSISWGGPESTWTQAAMTALDRACEAAAAMGITVCVASGDNGSSDGVSDGAPHVDFPASSPNVLACGGTSIAVSGSELSSEVAWSDSGGGVSAVFSLPPWQSGAHVPSTSGPGGRGVPDVCADADPNSGYAILVDGSKTVVGGTSASAPFWAATIALINQHTGTTAGLVNPKLYALPDSVTASAPLRDITSGSNGAYNAAPGWDPVTGLGRPDGSKLMATLT